MPTPPETLQRWPLSSGKQLHLRRNGEWLDLRMFNPDTTSGPGLPTDAGLCLHAVEWLAILRDLRSRLEGENADAEGDP